MCSSRLLHRGGPAEERASSSELQLYWEGAPTGVPSAPCAYWVVRFPHRGTRSRHQQQEFHVA